MSKTIDEKVVSMQFDNRNFEKNVKTSMSTLDKLKKALRLDGASKGFDDVEKAAKKVDLSPLEKGAEAVKVKFSAMQVAGVTAITRLTNAAITEGKKLTKSLSVDQITSGWSKYNEKTASVQTLLNSTGKSISEVNKYLNQLMLFSDETSYSFSEMTSALAQMTSSGGDVKKLIPLITGVANATAFAGKGAREFSSAIYNVNQMYSKGFILREDWKSLDTMGVSSKQLKQTIIDVGVEMGKIKKGQVTLANFTESLSKKWADTSVMEGAFGRFSEFSEAVLKAVEEGRYETVSEAIADMSDKYSELGVRAFQSAQEAKTFTEAIDATKDAVSSGWMTTSEIIFGNYEQAKKLWTELANAMYDAFAAGASDRNDLLKSALSGFGGKWDLYTTKVESAGISTDEFIEALIEAARKHNIAIDNMIASEGNFANTIEKGWLNTSIISDALNSFMDTEKMVSNTTGDLTDQLGYFKNRVESIWEDDAFTTEAERISELEKRGYDYSVVQEMVNKVLNKEALTLDDLSSEQILNLKYTADQIESLKELADNANMSNDELAELIDSATKPTGRVLLIDSIRNALKGLSKIVNTFKEAWRDIFPASTAKGIYNTIEAIHEFSKRLIISDEKAEKLKRAFKGIIAVFDVFKYVITTVVKKGFELLNKIFGHFNISILDIAANIGDALVAFRDWVKETDILGRAFDAIVSGIQFVIGFVKGLIDAFLQIPIVNKIVTAIGDTCKKVFSKLGANFSDGGKVIGDFLDRVKSLDGFSFENFKIALKDFKDNVLGHFFNMGDALDGVKEAFSNAFSGVIGFFKKIAGGAQTFGEGFVNVMLWIKDTLMHLDLGGVLAIGSAAGLIIFAKKFSSFINILTAPVKAFAGIGEVLGKSIPKVMNGFASIEKGFAKVLGGISLYLKGAAVLEFAKAIAIITASLVALSLLDTPAIWKAVGALSAIILAMSVMFFAMGQVGTEGLLQIAQFSALVLAFGQCMLLLSAALKVLSTMSAGQVVGGFIVITGFAAIITVMTALLSNTGPYVHKAAAVISAFGFACITLSLAAKILASIEQESLYRGMEAIAAFSGCLAILVIAAGIGAALGGDNLKRANKLIRSFTSCIFILSLAATICGSLTDDGFDKALACIGTFTACLVILIGVSGVASQNQIDRATGIISKFGSAMFLLAWTSKILASISIFNLVKGSIVISYLATILSSLITSTQFAEKGLDGAARVISKFGSAVLIMSTAMLILGLLSPEKIAKGLLAISGMAACIALLITSTKFAGKYIGDASKIILKFAVAVNLLLAPMMLLSLLGQDKIQKAITAIGGISLCITLLIAATRQARNVTGLEKLAIILGVMSASIAGLAMMNFPNVAGATAAMSAAILALTFMMKSLEKIPKGPKTTDRINQTIIQMSVIIGLLSGLLIAMSMLEPTRALASSAALSAVLISLGVCFKLLSKFKGITDLSLQQSFKLLTIVGVLTGFVFVLSTLEPLPALASAIGLSALMASFAVLCKVISGIKGDVDNAIPTIMQGMIVVGALTTIVSVLSLLDPISALSGATSLSLVMVAFGGMLKLMNGMSGSMDISLATAVKMGLILIAISSSLAILSSINPLNALAGSGVLSLTIASMIGICFALSKADGAFNNALTACLKIAAIAGLLSATIFILDSITNGGLGKFAIDILALAASCMALGLTASVLQPAIGAISSLGPALLSAGVGFAVIAADMALVGGTIALVIEAFRRLVVDVCNILGIHSPSTVFFAIGKFILEGLIKGIKLLFVAPIQIMTKLVGGIIGAVAKAPAMIADIAKSIISTFAKVLKGGFDTLVSIGKFLMQGLKNGIEAGFNIVKNVISGIAKGIKNIFCALLGIHSPSRVFTEYGEYMMEGLQNGLENNSDEVYDTVEEIATESIDTVKDALNVAGDSSKEFEEVGEESVKGWKKGVEASGKYLYETYEDLTTGIIKRVKVGFGDVLTEIEALTKDKIIDNLDLVRAAVEGYTVSSVTMVDNVTDQTKTIVSDYWNWRLYQENLNQKKVFDMQHEGEKNAKYTAKSMYDYQKEMTDKITKLIDDYKKTYKDTLKDIAKESDIFKKVDREDRPTKLTLQKNLKDQLKQTQDYAVAYRSLMKRLEGTSIKDVISKMKIDDVDELSALNDMTDKELEDYVKIYDEKFRLATNLANEQTAYLKEDLNKQISQIVGGVNVNLDEFFQIYDGTFESINEYVEKAVQLGTDIALGLSNGTKDGSKNAANAAYKMGELIYQNTLQALALDDGSEASKPYEIGNEFDVAIGDGLTGGSGSATSGIDSVMNDMLEEAQSYYGDFENIGADISSGIQNGVIAGGTVIDEKTLQNLEGTDAGTLYDVIYGYNEIFDMLKAGDIQSSDAAEMLANALGVDYMLEAYLKKGKSSSGLVNEGMFRSGASYEQMLNNFLEEIGILEYERYSEVIDAYKKGEISALSREHLAKVTIPENYDFWLNDVDSQLAEYVGLIQEHVGSIPGIIDLGLEEDRTALQSWWNELDSYDRQYLITNATNLGSTIGLMYDYGFKEGLLDPDAIDELVASAEQVSEDVVSTTNEELEIENGSSGVAEDQGEAYDSGLVEGLDSGSDDVVDKVEELTSDIESEFDNFEEEGNSFGAFFAKGLVNGMQKHEEEVRTVSGRLSKLVLDGVAKAAEIHSPSRKMAELGKFFTLGLVKGMDKNKDYVSDSAESLANSALSSSARMLANVYDIIDSGIDIAPRVSPVVDSSSIRASRFNLGAEIDTSFARPVDSLSKIISDAQAEINASNYEVISAINGLRNDIGDLGTTLGDRETALYVDSKKLATSIAKPMNRQLNILSQRGAY